MPEQLQCLKASGLGSQKQLHFLEAMKNREYVPKVPEPKNCGYCLLRPREV